jgi:hypothetical protein
MDEPLLRPPDKWTDELRTLTIDRLPLSCHPRLREQLPRGRTITDIEDDLARGAWFTRRRDRENEFRIGGSEFELRVKSRPAEQGQHPIAHVLNVDEARSVPRRVGWLAPRRVDFHDLWDEALCDLDALEVELARRLAFTDDVRGRSVTQRELEVHQELHRVVRREYGDLSTLIDLLEQRPVKAERTITGEVVGSGKRGRQHLLVVETGAVGLAEFRGKRVSLRLPDGRAFNTRVIRVLGRLLHIAEPQDWPGRKDGLVEVAGIPPFGLRRNGQAIEDLLAGRVEGAWHDLARLVCRPAELALPPLAPPQTFYCDVDPDAHPLNDEQRRAVTGAVASPHAFLVQGPPGTGKTEVISETIQQLVGRGERVLLLAPAHVAVDEVLKRVGLKPGMRPLRITFDDDKVDESVRAYLPQQVGVDLINRVLRPTGPGQAERWAAELVVIERQLAALTAARSAQERLSAVRELVQASGRRAAETGERLAAYRAQSDRELEHVRAELAAARQRHTEAKATDAHLAEVAMAIRTEWEPLLLEAGAAAYELSTAVRAEVTWTTPADNAARKYQTQLQEHAESLSRRDMRINQLNETIATERQRVDGAARAELSATDNLKQVETERGRMGQLAGRVGLGQVAEARRALANARSVAEQRRTALHNSEEQLAEEIKRRNDVDGRGRSWLAELRDTAERNRERAERAGWQRASALRRLLDVLARYDDSIERAETPVPADLAGDTAADSCGELAAAVMRVVEAVTPPIRAAGLDLRVEPTAFGGVLVDFVRWAGELLYAESARPDAQRMVLDTNGRLSTRMAEWRSVNGTVTAQLPQLERADRDMRALLNRHQAEAAQLADALASAAGEMRALGVADTPEELARLRRRQLVLTHLPGMERRWRELVEDHTDDQLIDDIQTSALRATNLVCATTKGIVGRGSDVVRDTDYDTLIVDEASRVTDSEFLIGAVRARRWVLVGDEHQLPPHVDQEDEHFLHALFALYRHHRGAATSVEDAVDQLADYWQEDAELREFRGEAVREVAAELAENGLWEATFQTRMAEAYTWFAKRDKADRARGVLRDSADQGDPDRALLRTMNQYLVRSLFERVVRDCAEGIKQPLQWQRRMPEPLARIVKEPVYGGAYLSPPDEELAKAGACPLVVPTTFDRPVVFIDTSRYRKDAEDSPARHGNGFENVLEQRMVLRACQKYHDELNRIRSQPITVSVLSFYRAQARALDDALDRKSLPLFDIRVVDVVDRIQGQQSDLVLISFVRAKDRGAIGPRFGSWLQDVRRLNVACTRARRALLLVGHADTLRRLGTNRDGTPRDANAVPAVNFYKNLFDLFEGSSQEFLMLRTLGQERAG